MERLGACSELQVHTVSEYIYFMLLWKVVPQNYRQLHLELNKKEGTQLLIQNRGYGLI